MTSSPMRLRAQPDGLGDLEGQFLDQRLVAANLLAHGLNGLTHRLNLLVERLDTLHQLRPQSEQLFRGQVIEIEIEIEIE